MVNIKLYITQINKDMDHCSEKGDKGNKCVDTSIISNDQLAGSNDDNFNIDLAKHQLTDRFYTRKLYENSKSFEPTFKITSFCNHSPEINTTDAMWKRIGNSKFESKFADKVSRRNFIERERDNPNHVNEHMLDEDLKNNFDE